MFHVSLLEPYNERDGVPRNPGPEIVDGQKEYFVEEILHRESIDGVDHFLTKWFGWGPEHDTWEPEEHVKGTDAFDEFLRNEKTQAKSRRPLRRRDVESVVQHHTLSTLFFNGFIETIAHDTAQPESKPLTAGWTFNIPVPPINFFYYYYSGR